MKMITGRLLIVFAAALAGSAAAADAQVPRPRLPVLVPLGQQGPPPMTAGALQADLVVKAGTDTVYFPPRGYTLDANSVAALSAQARWLTAFPYVNIRLEGHGDSRDTRDYAVAIGERRANAVRDFLILQGVSPHRITVLSWGKERPGSVRVGTALVATGARVKTVIR